MKKYTAIIISILIIFANILNGHYFAPNGITFTPFALGIMTLLMVQGADYIKPISKSGIIIGLIIIHDIGIKLYSGGTHDLEGLGWVNAFLLVGFIISYGILLIALYLLKEFSKREKTISAIIPPIAITIYLYFFHDLGLGR